ncbi:MAG: hypothetical protein LUG92_07060 [Oscillospiraceae bacterium]|nr:hypothetical protein [Oscillospiraceae bacterium]
MKFAVLGGDDRSVRLCRLLAADGHTVAACGLEKALHCQTLDEALRGADCAVLPLPAVKNGLINAPYSCVQLAPSEVLRAAEPETVICAGIAGALEADCAALGLRLYDYYAREDFTVANAELTAEGALALLLRESPSALGGARVLVCGFGRIGKLLALKLLALHARVSVYARSGGDRALARCLGMEAVKPNDLGALGGYDFVVNTIPAPVFGAAELEAFGAARLVELASAPGGFDAAAAESAGRRIIQGGGLPARISPETAGIAVRDAVYAILEESQ